MTETPARSAEQKFPSFPHEPISFGIAAWLFLISAAAVVWVLAAFNFLPIPKEWDLNSRQNSFAALFSLQGLVARPLFWVIEEILFRGFLLQVLRRAFSLPVALFLTAILFGLEHFAKGWPIMVLAFGASYYFSWLMIRTHSLYAPIVAHSSFDFAALYVVVPIAASTGHIAQGRYDFPYWCHAAAALIIGAGVFFLRRQLTKRPRLAALSRPAITSGTS